MKIITRIATVLLFVSALLLVCTAEATVTNSTRSIVFTPSAPTTQFTVTFHFLNKDHLKLTKTPIAGGAADILTRGEHYSVTLPVGSVNGWVTTFDSITTTHTLTVERVTPVTQTTAFRNQGSYSARRHEDSFDKITMIAQEVIAAAGTSSQSAVDTHVGLADAHTQYAILDGRAGGQYLFGGTAASNNLQLSSTDDATRGYIIFGDAGTTAYDEVNERFGIGTGTPSVELHVVGSTLSTVDVTTPDLYGGAASGGDLTLNTTSHATKGQILFGDSAYDEDVNRLGIGTLIPVVELDVDGEVYLGAIGSTRLRLDAAMILYPTDEVDEVLTITSGTAAAAQDDSAGIMMYGPSHTTKPGHLEIYSTLVTFADEYDEFTSAPLAYLDATGFSSTRETVEAGAANSPTIPEMCNDVYYTDTDSTVVTLPDINGEEDDGCMLTIVNTMADGTGLLSISPHSSDAIFGACVGTSVASPGAGTVTQFSGTDNKDIQNTKATQNQGDYVTVVSRYDSGSGADWWYVIGCMGMWVSES
jgi:hypothetical protein